ncbi:MAG TPA: M3 family oligoendopeptidase, partial [Cyclobacteriaceae bacterium]|nr:M3 family oligoendopeptidase [Cyclobacteriaceae bacterium]
MNRVEKIERPKRKFLPENFTVTDWPGLKPCFDNLLMRELNSVEAVRQWLRDRSELESVISEDLAWRYINMTRYTDNQEYSRRYEDFVVNIQPQIAPVSDQLNKKAAASPFLAALEKESGYNMMIRNLKKDIEIFREENIPLYTEITTEQQ